MSKAMTARQEGWSTWIAQEAKQVVAALPVTIADSDLRRAAARLRVAFADLPIDSKVYDCTPDSVVHCLAMSAMTGLFPGGPRPDVDLIPRKKILNWQISANGYTRLCRRTTGWDLQTIAILTGDTFSRGRDSERGSWYVLEPGEGATGDSTKDWDALQGVLIIVTSPIGEKFDYLTKGQIEQRRRCAEYDSVWRDWPIEQARKTACRFAGQREMFPTDDPTRYAFDMEMKQPGFEPRSSLLPTPPTGPRFLPELPPDLVPPPNDPDGTGELNPQQEADLAEEILGRKDAE